MVLLVSGLVGAGTGPNSVERVSGGPDRHLRCPAGIHKIRHVIIVMQENRSFDSYFGTFPGADGIPMKNGVPTVCIPDPATGGCDRPFHTVADVNGGGPHGHVNAVADIDGGKMDGFVGEQERPPVQRPRRPGVHGETEPGARCDGLPQPGRGTQLLGLRQGLRARRPHVRAGELLVGARPPLPGLGLVGSLCQQVPDELCEQHHRPLRRPALQPSRRPGAEDGHDVDRPGLDR